MILRAWIFVFALCLFGSTGAGRPPNFLIFLVDDLGRSDCGFMGGRTIRTPQIDALAASGMVLESFYAQPVCTPTRAALLTGRYPMRYGLQGRPLFPHAQHGLPPEERTLPQALREAGYETAMFGKWHLGHAQKEFLPRARGFDRHYGNYLGALDYYTHLRDGGLDWHRDGQPSREEGYTTALLATDAVRFLRARDAARPFLVYVAFNAVHSPYQDAPEPHRSRYAHLEPGRRRAYATMLSAADAAVGEILAALDTTGQRENTLVLFLSDNGGPEPGRLTDNGALRAGKGTLYEGGVRVVACVSWPGRVPPGGRSAAILHAVDIYPTFLRLAGVSLSQRRAIDGLDVSLTLRGEADPERSEMLINVTETDGAIRVGDWKLVVNGDVKSATEDDPGPPRSAADEKVELFDLSTDPGEQRNLAAGHPARVRDLRERLSRYANEAAPRLRQPRPADFLAPAVWGMQDAPVDSRDGGSRVRFR